MAALIKAAKKGDNENVIYHLVAGADIDFVNVRGWRWTALVYAAYKGHLETVKVLLNAGATVDTQTRDGYTALLWAAKYGRLEIVKELINAGANINTQNKFGNTALMLAAYNGRVDLVQTLLKAGAKLHACNKAKRTALDHAKLQRNDHAIRALQAALRTGSRKDTHAPRGLRQALQQHQSTACCPSHVVDSWSNRM
eukprot:m.2019 g.2019  ORF g.2019 m.2019 type:complete len:197 (-) comp1423_c0_seq1:140-730(-)